MPIHGFYQAYRYNFCVAYWMLSALAVLTSIGSMMRVWAADIYFLPRFWGIVAVKNACVFRPFCHRSISESVIYRQKDGEAVRGLVCGDTCAVGCSARRFRSVMQRSYHSDVVVLVICWSSTRAGRFRLFVLCCRRYGGSVG